MLYRSFMSLSDLHSAEQSHAHADLRAAAAANAAARASRRRDFWADLVPAALRNALARRAADRMLVRSITRLSETSAHLLDDVGIDLAPDVPTSAAHAAHLQADIATAAPQSKAAAPARQVTKPVSAPARLRRQLAAVGG